MNPKILITYVTMFLVLIAALLNYNNVDQSEKSTAGIAVVAIVAAILSVQQSIESNQKTEKALILTETTLKLTETEQQVRDLEKRLDLFYYPVYDYQNSTTGTGFGNLNDKRADFNRAVSFRYLAIEKETREKLELFLEKKGKTEEDSNEIINILKADIQICEKKIEEYEHLI